MDHSLGTATVRSDLTAQRHTADECSVAGDKTRRDHTIQDIICYSWLLLPYCIGFYLPCGHLSGIGSHCNCPALSYKRLGQMSVLGVALNPNSGRFNSWLEQRTHSNITLILLWT
jgi:hypothetical protein